MRNDGYKHPNEPSASVGDEYTHQDFGLCVVHEVRPTHKFPIKLHCTDYQCFIFCDLNGMQYASQFETKLKRKV